MYQEDALESTRLRLIRNACGEDYDLGNEGNKSTYLRPSRNRDMSSLIEGKSRSVSNVGGNSQREGTQESAREDVVEPKKGVIMPKLKTAEVLRV